MSILDRDASPRAWSRLWSGPVDAWWAAPLPWVAYALALSATGGLRWEHVIAAALVTALVHGGPRARAFFVHAAPLLVMFLLYDAMRWFRDVGLASGRVIGCALHDAELRWFGVGTGAARRTPNELLAAHRSPALDLLCAIPYGAYIPILAVTFLWLYARDRPAARRLAWIALGTHLLGFATYHLAPAAPPWYVRTRGCAIDLATANDPAGLARVDALLGIHYFHSLYGRGAAVFGALPSLHAAYPLFGLLATLGRARPRAVAAHLGYAAIMVFAAIYLEHHYVFDLLLGVVYALVAWTVVRRFLGDGMAEREEKTARAQGSE